MQAMKWSILALAVAAGTTQLAFADQQSESKGFVEDSKLNLLNRNYYFNRDRDGGSNDRRDWSHGFLLNYASGFTQGTVGVGVDAFGYLGIKLDGGKGYAGTGNLPIGNDGSPNDEYSTAGASVKLRISNTILKYGNLQPTSPVFAVGGSRLFPQTATGFMLTSEEIENLFLEAGHFTAGRDNINTYHDGNIGPAYATFIDNSKVTSRSGDYVGGKYKISDQLSTSLYYGRLEDVWNQYYANLNYVQPLAANQSLTFDANYYYTKDTGSAKAGDISNNAFSLAAAYSIDAHTFTVGFQKINGNTPFDYVGAGGKGAGSLGSGGDSIFLANSIQFSDFNAPGEKSWQARYDLNMATLGVPGLSFMTRYVRGTGIEATSNAAYAGIGYQDGDKEHETNLEAKYVLQSGPAKDLSFRIRQTWHRGDVSTGSGNSGNVNEFRLITEYPLSIL
ncbi:OprD family porin [Pseudomonas sp. HR1]|uniref:OprD family porin n=1 Tax=Pseudomonas TaxID=286 RepID=UPI0012386396|nr:MULTISPECIES: OprD family porin [Pseudomonas]MDK4200180.1 OprD family porin [Pseudomonas sp. HR1]NMZ64423.1 OprD family porin [Pseudomonas oryzihabitans]QEU02484.1 OprD family porin [Pseudomonas oryzihabitans]